MSDIAKKTITADLEQEMRQSYLDYAMSVIVGRSLPDIRDGLKPVHRRILYAMLKLGNDWNKPYKKSARVTGDVIGKYHPHGDASIYDAIVRMAQDFSMRYPLIDGQGNFGSIDGDPPAAMRYTEVRLSRIAHEMLVDIEKETVDFVPNYDETEQQPLVLPARLPNLLLNGSEGIAVGMATKIPPHNLSETISACLALIEDENLTVKKIMELLPGPDFPTGGIINGTSGIIEAYNTGRGSVRMRGKVEIEPIKNSKRQALIVTELPYQVIKSRLIEQIADLVQKKDLEGISNVQDESDKSGMRIVIELKASATPQIIERSLYLQTRLESTFGINLVALENNQPRIFGIKHLLLGFIRHRREVVTRKFEFELRKAEQRAHLLEGFTVALSNMDKLIQLIRGSASRAEAKEKLLDVFWSSTVVLELLQSDPVRIQQSSDQTTYGLSDRGYKLSVRQVDAILDMRLHRLTGLEREKVFNEFTNNLAELHRIRQILQSADLLMKEISNELIKLREQFGKNDARRTEIIETDDILDNKDFIEKEDVVVTISHAGYVKRQPVSDYSSQRRGGRGKSATSQRDDDFVSQMFVASSHDLLLCFTSSGKVYSTDVYRLFPASRTAKGRPLVNVLPALEENEKVTAVLPMNDSIGSKFIVMSTKLGLIKRCKMKKFENIRSNGKIAIKLREDDELVHVGLSNGNSDIILVSSGGRATRFSEKQIRVMGRKTLGVKGIKLKESEHSVAMLLISPKDKDKTTLLASDDGNGKRTSLSEFRVQSRGGLGVFVLPSHKRNNTKMVDALLVQEGDEIALIADSGKLIRTQADSISIYSRAAAGLRLINLLEDERLVRVASIQENDPDDDLNAGDQE